MGMTHRRRISGVSVNGTVNGSALNFGNQANGVDVARAKRRDSVQNGIQGGIQFLQRAVEGDLGDSDPGSPLLDDLDPDEEDQVNSDPRMKAEAKSIRKVITPRHLLALFDSDHLAPCRLRTSRSPIGR
jgi:hypothetical protein